MKLQKDYKYIEATEAQLAFLIQELRPGDGTLHIPLNATGVVGIPLSLADRIVSELEKDKP